MMEHGVGGCEDVPVKGDRAISKFNDYRFHDAHRGRGQPRHFMHANNLVIRAQPKPCYEHLTFLNPTPYWAALTKEGVIPSTNSEGL
jgi:hypothetical protein